ncbi:hypothetical protein [Natronococcus wangiae]|uniref:hypothetical protein n=1 Tax=Natronococcus wangiae TaxID=3068275 RepID=UPI00273E85DD|nr:hypothetical protein [Natronococcus sp. AD5]
MSVLVSYAITLAALNWLGIAALVGADARKRGVRTYWQWSLLTVLLGFFGALLYVLYVAVPSDR